MRKPRTIGALIILLLAVAAVTVLVGPRFMHKIANDTYEHAMAADDAGDAQKARKLFEEACREGSKQACKALREEQDKKADPF